MKKLCLIMLICIMQVSICYPMALKLTEQNNFSLKGKAGLIYSLKKEQNEWEGCALFEVYKLNGISANIGWAYSQEVIASVMIDITSILPEKIGNIPALLIEAGPFIGYDTKTGEIDYGAVGVCASIAF